MNRRSGLTIIIILAMVAWVGSALASPKHLPSITDKVKSPGRIAIDSQGNLYLSDDDKLLIYNNKGVYQRSLSIPGLFAVAVDQTGRIYAGSEKSKAVMVYNPDLAFSHNLGSGAGEFSRPNAIAMDGSGRIYVVDSLKNIVKVYETNGQFAFSFGGSGNTDGLFTTPTTIAINDAANEVYVADLQRRDSDGASGARIQVFDKNGNSKNRPLGQYGQSVGQMTRPVDIAVDARTGNLYVVDSFQSAVLIMDPATGAISDALYDLTPGRQLVTPQGAVISRNGIVYIASYNGKSIEQYALDGYVTMDIAPAALSFTSTQYAPSPPAQTVSIANSGSGTENWAAASDKPWITLGQTSGSAAPAGSSDLSIGVSSATLAPGTYTGTVSVTSDFGRTDAVTVTHTVLPPPVLSLSNGWLTFGAKKGTNAPSQTVMVGIDNISSLSWSANSNAPWLSISPASGSASASSTVSVASAGLAAGTYTGAVTFSAPGVVGYANKLTVTLTVFSSSKIIVTTNRSDAKFTVTGPVSSSGTGTSWNMEDAPAGDYTVTFDAVAGFKKPAPQRMTLAENSEASFVGTYLSLKDLAARKNIITAKGPWVNNDAGLKTYKVDGTPVPPDIAAGQGRYGANIATGDIDGDGTAEIIVGTGAGPENTTLVSIYRSDKTKLLDFVPFVGRFGGVNVAAADVTGGGKAVIFVAPAGGSENPGVVKAFLYDSIGNKMVPTGLEIVAHNTLSGVNIAAADTEGTNAPRLITAPVSGTEGGSGSIKLWQIDVSRGAGNWTASVVQEIPMTGSGGATVASGDIDGDGKDEIIAGMTADKSEKSLVKIFRADGRELMVIPVFTEKYGVNVAAADLDGDGIAEIIAGIGPDPGVRESESSDDREERRNKKGKTTMQKIDREGDHGDYLNGTVRIYNAAGSLLDAITPYGDTKYGVKVSVGDLGL